jgi:hypothetical protein
MAVGAHASLRVKLWDFVYQNAQEFIDRNGGHLLTELGLFSHPARDVSAGLASHGFHQFCSIHMVGCTCQLSRADKQNKVTWYV